MSLLYMDGFEGQDYDTRYTLGVSGTQGTQYIQQNIWSTVDATKTRFNSGSALSLTLSSSFYAVSSLQSRAIPAANKLFVGLACNVTSSDSVATIGVMSNNGSSGQCYVRLDGVDRSLTVYRGSPLSTGTVLGTTGVGAFPVGGWFHVEMSTVLGKTTGACEVRLDGNTVLTLTGINNQQDTSTNIISGIILGASSTGTKETICTTYFDDLYVCDDQGTTNNTFLGDVRVQTLTPNGAGSSTQLTPTGSASNYANVNDVPDSNTTYNSSNTVGQRDTYAMSDLDAATGTVYGVQQVTHAFKTTAGDANLKAAQQSGSIVSYGATNSLGTTNQAYFDLNETNPATSAPYTPTDINDIEAGAEVA